ncbi:hypothetical protein N7540_002700 [Penicillium herquei]|nr:hypothetical protein N7540_002700 [Penicillium herquei]
MCGNSKRPAVGGTIAVLFPPMNSRSSSPESSLSSSPDSITSSTSMSSYSLFFRESEADSCTKAIFRIDDAVTYNALRACRQVDLRIEKYGDLSTGQPATPPLHQFRLDLAKQTPRSFQTDIIIELPDRLDLGVSEKGVVGRQITMIETDGSILGVGIVGYN